jgi:radical SAM superfamily enzyme YgiQ (UPF0313 family)
MERIIKKIALINPSTFSSSEIHMYDMYKRNKKNYKPYLASPLNLLTIASYTPSDIEIRLIDENLEKINFEEVFDLVGITAMSQQASRAYAIAAIFRKKNIPVVMGGIHASVLPEEALLHVDTVFLGEAEELWKLFLDDFRNGNEKRIYKSETLFNLEKSIIPRYDLINYTLLKSNDSHINLIPIQATRGCPHDCNFCIVSKYYGKKIRKKSVSQILKEVEYLKSNNYDSLVLFVDDNLFVDRKFSKELLKKLIPLKISYIAQTDVRVSNDDELLELAYQSGCVLMLIGFESIDRVNLCDVNTNKWKMNQLDTYRVSIKKIQEKGIIVFGAFIIGFENDSESSFEKIKNFVLDTNISAHFTILTALPGSRLYDQFKAENKFFNDVYWDDLSFYNISFKHEKISRSIAEKQIIRLYDEVYSDENTLKRYYQQIQHFKKLQPRWNYED